jgi:hypothetical protein
VRTRASCRLQLRIRSSGKTRQAPHYYEPYCGYLLYFIMSYAFHVDLFNHLNDASLR